MNHKELISNQISNDITFKLEDYFLNSQSGLNSEDCRKIIAFNELNFNTKKAKLTNWDFLNHKDVEKLMNLENENEIKEFISNCFKKSLKDKPKDVLIELMTSVQKFCRTQNFNLEQTGSVLSFFYLTHLYFTSYYDTTAEKVYIYFKDLIMCHSIPFPTTSKKIFALKEAKDIMQLFGKIYLRYLPLIRYICLPNYALFLNYELPPEPVLLSKKGKDGKKEKKPKGDKKVKKNK